MVLESTEGGSDETLPFDEATQGDGERRNTMESDQMPQRQFVKKGRRGRREEERRRKKGTKEGQEEEDEERKERKEKKKKERRRVPKLCFSLTSCCSRPRARRDSIRRQDGT